MITTKNALLTALAAAIVVASFTVHCGAEQNPLAESIDRAGTDPVGIPGASLTTVAGTNSEGHPYRIIRLVRNGVALGELSFRVENGILRFGSIYVEEGVRDQGVGRMLFDAAFQGDLGSLPIVGSTMFAETNHAGMVRAVDHVVSNSCALRSQGITAENVYSHLQNRDVQNALLQAVEAIDPSTGRRFVPSPGMWARGGFRPASVTYSRTMGAFRVTYSRPPVLRLPVGATADLAGVLAGFVLGEVAAYHEAAREAETRAELEFAAQQTRAQLDAEAARFDAEAARVAGGGDPLPNDPLYSRLVARRAPNSPGYYQCLSEAIARGNNYSLPPGNLDPSQPRYTDSELQLTRVRAALGAIAQALQGPPTAPPVPDWYASLDAATRARLMAIDVADAELDRALLSGYQGTFQRIVNDRGTISTDNQLRLHIRELDQLESLLRRRGWMPASVDAGVAVDNENSEAIEGCQGPLQEPDDNASCDGASEVEQPDAGVAPDAGQPDAG